jgi:RNA polymerase sigma-70 factor (ECF subfamily)
MMLAGSTVAAGSDDAITVLLKAWSGGDAGALPRLVDLVYPELHRIAARHLARERPGHTLQPTALVHEAYVRMAQQAPGRDWQDRTHFFAVAAHVVRAVLVDHARARRAAKRGSGAITLDLNDVNAAAPALAPVDFLDLDAALQSLEALDAEQGRIVELRYFAGLSIEETAEALGTSPSTVKRGWLAAKTYIRRRLDGGAGPRDGGAGTPAAGGGPPPGGGPRDE